MGNNNVMIRSFRQSFTNQDGRLSVNRAKSILILSKYIAILKFACGCFRGCFAFLFNFYFGFFLNKNIVGIKYILQVNNNFFLLSLVYV